MTDNQPQPYEDIVPRPPITLETLARLQRMAGQTVTITEPGEFIEDVDGQPLAIGEDRKTTATVSGATISYAEVQPLLAERGMTRDDLAIFYPNLTFI